MTTVTGVARLIDEADRRRLTVAEVMEMARTGILDEDERVELLDGVLVRMSPINPPHADAVRWLMRLFVRSLSDDFVVLVQDPVFLSTYSLPQPDVAIARAMGRTYRRRHPEPPEILLVVEVADTTLRNDRVIKMPLYAAAGIAEAWIVDLVHRQLLVYRRPVPDGLHVNRGTWTNGRNRTARLSGPAS
jgi:Uma2 family endonuclease